MNEKFVRNGPLMELDSYPRWAQDMMLSTLEAKEKVVKHDLFAMMRDAVLTPKAMRNFLIGGWPVVVQFPQFMAVNLCKIQYGRSLGENMARKYLMKNIRVEQNHAEHWVEWAKACAVSERDLLDSYLPVESQALSHWCWHSSEHTSLATSMAATNLAIEGATGEWASLVCSAPDYENSFAPEERKKAMRWLKLHAHYDDTHPWEALDIIASLIGWEIEPKYAELLGQCVMNSYKCMTLSLNCYLSEICG
ncbi:MAG TPA: TenA family transcriptional regulator [Janthinobacterium sp.]|nr:TenA family transcriptional regulator [Janthinobacterium sp.]